MRQHLGKEYTIREVSFNDPYAMHFDCSIYEYGYLLHGSVPILFRWTLNELLL